MESHKGAFSLISETVDIASGFCDRKVVEGDELIPQLPLAIDISVRYVEDFIACFVFIQPSHERL
jgi:hypothetical protein